MKVKFSCVFIQIHISFINEKNFITPQAVEILKNNGLCFTFLTKAGLGGTNDFRLIEGYEKASFGSTINFFSNADIIENEPKTARLFPRLKAIRMARKKGIKTWLNIEPVKHPDKALEFIKKKRNIVDQWRIGKVNCYPEIVAEVEWIRFREEAKALLESVGANYYFKKSLSELAVSAAPGEKTVTQSYTGGTMAKAVTKQRIAKPDKLPKTEKEMDALIKKYRAIIGRFLTEEQRTAFDKEFFPEKTLKEFFEGLSNVLLVAPMVFPAMIITPIT